MDIIFKIQKRQGNDCDDMKQQMSWGRNGLDMLEKQKKDGVLGAEVVWLGLKGE